MRILQVNFSDALGGGAQIIASRLGAGYRARGHETAFVVGFRNSNEPDVIALPNDAMRRAPARLALELRDRVNRRRVRARWWAERLVELSEPVRTVRRRLVGHEDFDFPATSRLLELAPWRPDVLHLHNLHRGYFDMRQLPALTAAVPTVVTLHDSWLMTGHCAHPLDSDRWRTGCGHCPHLDTYPAVPRDATAFNWKRKLGIYRRSSLYLATPARWMAERIPESILAPAALETRVIPQGAELAKFRPGDRDAARNSLGLPQEPFIALFAANLTRSNWAKDSQTLDRTMELVGHQANRPILLLCVGEAGSDRTYGSAEIRFVDHTGSPERMTPFYNAADVYLHASRADTFPNTVVEALASGTPVIATAVGGIREQIEDGFNGYLVPPRDGEAMAMRVVDLMEDSERCRVMGETARERAIRDLDFERTTDSYVEWFQEIIEGRADRAARRASSISA